MALCLRQAAYRKKRAVMAIDVIVPAHGNAAALRRCLESVLAAPQVTAFEVVVVDDGMADVELSYWLRNLAGEHRITLLDAPERPGLAEALNRGVALHQNLDRDVVVLQGDTEVAGNWLDRLAAHARADDIGTVVPLASAGGVAGYPRSETDNAIPRGQAAASLDQLSYRANAGTVVEVPVSFGPCIFIHRACLNSVGAFNAVLDGADAGVFEEFSLRAAGAGFRHLLAVDVCVWHQGDGDLAKQSALQARHLLDKDYPHYRVARADLTQRDPARPFQRRIDLLRLAESPRQLLLFVAHAWGGGVRFHMHQLAALIDERCDVLLLEPATDDTVQLSWMKSGEAFVAYFSLPREAPVLISLLRQLGLARIHFHHVHGLPPMVLDLAGATGVPYDCTLHDYYPICPQYHLVTEDGRYCGEPDAAGCTACISRRPSQWGLDITAWRATFHEFMAGASRVFAPSRDVAQRIAGYFPDVEIAVLPHAEVHALIPRVVRVVTLGRLSPEKGLRVVAECAADARARALPLSFRVLGPTTERVPQWPDAALSVHGQYANRELPALIAAERPDVIWFPSQVPESYSYTLSAALDSGAAIVASALGALPERLAGHPRAILVPADASAAAWNKALLEAGGTAHAARIPPPRIAVS